MVSPKVYEEEETVLFGFKKKVFRDLKKNLLQAFSCEFCEIFNAHFQV